MPGRGYRENCKRVPWSAHDEGQPAARPTRASLRQDFFDFKPTFKLFIIGNHEPRLSNVDPAMRRRLLLVPFAVEIPETERDQGSSRKIQGRVARDHALDRRWLSGMAAHRSCAASHRARRDSRNFPARSVRPVARDDCDVRSATNGSGKASAGCSPRGRPMRRGPTISRAPSRGSPNRCRRAASRREGPQQDQSLQRHPAQPEKCQ